MQESWLQPGGFYDGDLNADGLVNSDDFNVVQQNWLMTSSGLPAGGRTTVMLDRRSGMPVIVYIPEPFSALLAASRLRAPSFGHSRAPANPSLGQGLRLSPPASADSHGGDRHASHRHVTRHKSFSGMTLHAIGMPKRCGLFLRQRL